MRVSLIAIGGKMPAWVEQGVAEYRKRLPPEIQYQIIELPLAKRGKTSSAEKIKEDEGKALLAQVPKGDKIIALDVLGKTMSTEKLAKSLARWQMEGDNISLLVGGPDGLSQACLQQAQERWSLSALTMPHPLVRVLFTEQLYRAWAINNNHPYHK